MFENDGGPWTAVNKALWQALGKVWEGREDKSGANFRDLSVLDAASLEKLLREAIESGEPMTYVAPALPNDIKT